MKIQSKPLEIGHEYIDANEDFIIQEMVNEMQAQMTRMYSENKMKRQIHTKMHGCVKGRFKIAEDLPEELKVGIFKNPDVFNCYVRFSNSQTEPQPDKKKDIRGIAIKLLNVPGEKILFNKRDPKTQDFLLMSSETFFSKNIGEFRKTLKATTSKSKLKLVFYFLNPKHWGLLKKLLKTFIKCDNLLNIGYWSTQPYSYGNDFKAVKYYLKPSPENHIINENTTDDNYLRTNLSQTLLNNSAKFDFYIQFQTDAENMPIEDPTVAWDSEFIKVASLEIPAQDFNTKAIDDFGENLSFNSWHTLTEHRPLGSFNRARRRVYEAMSEFRHQHNNEEQIEPEDSQDFLDHTFWSKNNTIPYQIPEKTTLVVKSEIMVDCSKKTAFDFIISSDKLHHWLKTYGSIKSVLYVENLSETYDHVGAKRMVHFDGGDTTMEELMSYRPYSNYSYKAYRFTNVMKKLTSLAYGQLWFDSIGDKTRITWVYRFTYKNFLSKLILKLILKFMFKKFMANSLKNAKNYIENGN